MGFEARVGGLRGSRAKRRGGERVPPLGIGRRGPLRSTPHRHKHTTAQTTEISRISIDSNVIIWSGFRCSRSIRTGHRGEQPPRAISASHDTLHRLGSWPQSDGDSRLQCPVLSLASSMPYLSTNSSIAQADAAVIESAASDAIVNRGNLRQLPGQPSRFTSPPS